MIQVPSVATFHIKNMSMEIHFQHGVTLKDTKAHLEEDIRVAIYRTLLYVIAEIPMVWIVLTVLSSCFITALRNST